MIKSLSNYKVGDRLVLRRTGEYQMVKKHPSIEVSVLEKAPRLLKVLVVTKGWYKVGSVQWVSAKDPWEIVAKLPPAEGFL